MEVGQHGGSGYFFSLAKALRVIFKSIGEKLMRPGDKFQIFNTDGHWFSQMKGFDFFKNYLLLTSAMQKKIPNMRICSFIISKNTLKLFFTCSIIRHC